MRELTLCENNEVSGGLLFFDGSSMMNTLRKQAFGEGLAVSAGTSFITGLGFWAAGATFATTLAASAVIAPYGLLIGYVFSNNWNLFK